MELRAQINFVVCFLLSVGMPCVAYSFGDQDSVATDSTQRSYVMQEVFVTALRLPQTASLTSSPVTILTGEELQRTNASSLSQLLAPVSGFFVKDYGGNSGLKTLAQRGLGPEHTLVLLNGMRVSNPQNALVDLGLFGADEIERLEVLHGGQSATFGADAVAGAVNIVSAPNADARNAKASMSVGSFGYKHFGLSGGGRIADVIVRGAYREEKGNENFPFSFHNGPELTRLVRTNADFTSRSGTLTSSYTFSQDAEAILYARSFSSERGVGGQVVGPAPTSVARQKDNDNLTQLTFRFQSDRWRYRMGLQYHDSYLRYRDNSFIVGGTVLDSYYSSKEWRIEPRVEHSLTSNARVAFGGEIAFAEGEGNSLLKDTRRSTVGGFVTVEQQLLGDSELIDGLLLYPSLRFDAITTGPNALSQWSPQLGVVIPFHALAFLEAKPTLRASVSRNFRVPTFNELFYAGGGGIGNPNLQPERSTSIDVGASTTFRLLGKHVVQTSYFDIDMSERIMWVAAGGQSVTPKNIRTVRSRGVELAYSWTSNDNLIIFSANYSSSDTKKISQDFPGDRNINVQLVYIPQETAYLSLTISKLLDDAVLKHLAASFASSFAGFRYTAEDNRDLLPSYWLAQVNLRARVKLAGLSLTTRVEANNLFDKDYQILLSYPMPGRSYKLTFGVEY